MKEWNFRTISQATEWADKRDLTCLTLHATGSQIKLSKQNQTAWIVLNVIKENSQNSNFSNVR